MVDEPVIITGGSVTITFNKEQYTGTGGRHSCPDRRIVSIDIVDDNTNESQTVYAPENGKCTITIHTE